MDINWLDIILIFSMLVSGLLALTQGFIKEILSLIGWVISFISVTVLMPGAGKFLRPFIESESVSDLITIGLIFLVTLMIWRVASLLIVKLFKVTSISYIDRIFNITQWTEMPCGGHFAAMEQPDLLVNDIIKFSRTLR